MTLRPNAMFVRFLDTDSIRFGEQQYGFIVDAFKSDLDDMSKKNSKSVFIAGRVPFGFIITR